ncbi:CGNR zinc finger domain-containing protein [Pseudomonas segetis]
MNTADNRHWTTSDFIADDPVLDFLNTTGAKGKQRINERLHSCRALIDWALAAQLVTEDEHQRLLQLSQAETATAGRELDQIILWREALYALMHAASHEQKPEGAALHCVENVIKQALASAQLHYTVGEPGFWGVDSENAGIATIRHRLALQLNKGITGGKYQQTKECEACTWMFIDTSRSRRRRWCSMSTCGNRAKARRFYQGENKA